jgi:hypothetical protein
MKAIIFSKTKESTRLFTKLPIIIFILLFTISACKQDDEILNPDSNEPNDTKQEATELVLGEWMTAYAGETDTDWYIFTVTHDAYDVITIETQNMSDVLEIELEILDADGNSIISQGGGNGANVNINLSAPAGTYYVKITSRYEQNSGEYKIKVANSNANDDYEPNETSDTAADLGTLPVAALEGALVSPYEKDWYKFTTENSGVWDRISIDITNNSDDLELYAELHDTEMNSIDYIGGANGANISLNLPTKGGDFYLMLKSRYESNKGNYTLTAQNLNLNDDYEPDDTFADARIIDSYPTGNLSGTIVYEAANDNGGDYEFYKVSVLAGKKVEFSVDPEATNTELHFGIYDHNEGYTGSSLDGSDGETLNYYLNNSSGSDAIVYVKLGGYPGDNGNYTISFTETTAD